MRCLFLSKEEGSETQDSEILQALKVAEEDSRWFSEKYEQLQAKYEGRVLGIRNKNIVADAESVDELLDVMQKKGEDTTHVLIETIPARDLSFILLAKRFA